MCATQAPPSIRIFLVSDYRLVLSGLAQVIDGQAGAFTLAGAAASIREALEEPELAMADIILLDMDGEAAPVQEAIARLLSGSQAKILVLTRLDDQDKQDQAVLAGARGVVRHNIGPDMLLAAFAKVQQGQMWLDREATGRVFVKFSHHNGHQLPSPLVRQISSLTHREQRIVVCIAENSGETGKTIAKRLHISESTLRNHLTSIYGKLGVANRNGLLAYAFKHGLGNSGA